MRLFKITACIFSFVILISSFTYRNSESLREIYSRDPSQWPAPFIDENVEWKELGILPDSPLKNDMDSIRHLVTLWKILFFDTRISGSGKIACASCHKPELSWTDGLARSVGHEGAINKRNSLSIQNVWFYKKLFWDGRSRDLEDQAFAPINSESEMHTDMRELPFRLSRIKGYKPLFTAAFGDERINPDRIADALATFQRTITSRQSRFDEFLAGNKKILSNAELKGLHLFRTKARCMNCHHGPLLTDNRFHNVGFHKDGLVENDPGLYNVTHKDSDAGKFRTPTLRDVMKTGPWMHHGGESDMVKILDQYNLGMASESERLIKPLSLTKRELSELLAFLQAISAPPAPFQRPSMPAP